MIYCVFCLLTEENVTTNCTSEKLSSKSLTSSSSCFPGNRHRLPSYRHGYKAEKMATNSDNDDSDGMNNSDDEYLEATKKSWTDSKGLSRTNEGVKEKLRRKFCLLSYGNFLLQTRLALDRQTANDKAQDINDEGHYADDKSYLQGEFYRNQESDEDVGFAGDLAQEFNLIPSDSVGDQKRTFTNINDELGIRVVPSERFVREITDKKTEEEVDE